MNILIAGASGLIGQALIHSWHAQHTLTVLGRNRAKLQTLFPENIRCIDWEMLNMEPENFYDCIINLSGKNIADQRWTDKVKKELIQSRVKTTEILIQWAARTQNQAHFFCANAVGIYGLQDNTAQNMLDEDSPIDVNHPKDFLQEIGVQWQKAAEKALEVNIPLTITRFGVVLKKNKGILKKLAPAFKLGLGSIIGSGQQMLSWIHIDDVVLAFDFLITHRAHLQGAFNLCSPNPVQQKRFAKALSKAMHRPLFLKTPALLIRLLFGEMGECLINRGQQVIPKRLLEAGYTFKYPDIDRALEAEIT